MDLASPSFYMWHDVTYKHAVILILKIHLLGLLTSIILLDTWGGVYIKPKYYYLKKIIYLNIWQFLFNFWMIYFVLLREAQKVTFFDRPLEIHIFFEIYVRLQEYHLRLNWNGNWITWQLCILKFVL